MELVCSTGKVNAEIGDRYTDRWGEWEIVGFSDDRTYSPSSLGGTPDVVVKPMGHEMPSAYDQYAHDDGTIDICGDSVAAMILSNQDGKPRDARGFPLRDPGQASSDPL
jgi:hypothetical protein